jgi:transcriptional regulator with XRE-family HTH domain
METGVILLDKYGLAIRDLRIRNGDTIETLAKKLKITESALGKYERGERKVKPDFLLQVASVYNVRSSYFFGEEGEIPEELKEVGVEWIAFAKEMKQKNLTPEQIKATLELLETLGIGKK